MGKFSFYSKEAIKKRRRNSYIKAVESLYDKKEISRSVRSNLLKDIKKEERESKKKPDAQKAVKKVDSPRKKVGRPKKKRNIDDWIG